MVREHFETKEHHRTESCQSFAKKLEDTHGIRVYILNSTLPDMNEKEILVEPKFTKYKEHCPDFEEAHM